MDYKKLLIKYLAHVADVNGDTLTYNVKLEDHPLYNAKSIPFFSVEEERELDLLEKEAYKMYKDIH